jgi:putative lipoprotein
MRYRLCLLLCLLVPGCAVSDLLQPPAAEEPGFQPDERPLATTLVYDCDDYEFVARLGPGEMALWLPDQYIVLPQVRSASGTLYEEGDISFWSKGDDAMLTVADQIYQQCQLQPQRVPWEDARRRGVDFRAIGNEPGWFLEIQSGKQLLFVYGYGIQRALVPGPTEDNTDTVRMYSGMSGEHELQVEIVEQTCSDNMSGEQFPNRVVVIFDDTRYEGCGQDLEYLWEEQE